MISFNMEDEVAEEPDDIIPEEGVNEGDITGITLKYYNSKLLSNKPLRNNVKNKNKNGFHQSQSAVFNHTLNQIPKSMIMKKPMGLKQNLGMKTTLKMPLKRSNMTKSG